MATSGTSNFQANRDQIITSSLRKVAAIAEGETPSQEMLDNGAFLLDAIIKEAHVDGMPLWAIEEMTIPCSSFSQGQYNITVPAPLKVLYAYLRDNSNPNNPIDIPLQILTHYDYNWLASKLDMGMPIQFFYNPDILSGTLKVWPIPDNYSKMYRQVIITYQRPFEDAGSGTNTLDFPPSWNLALIYQLAWILAPEYGLPPTDRTALAKEAEIFRDRALSFGTEEGSLFVRPEYNPYK